MIGQRRQIALLRRALVHDLHLVARGGHVVAALPLRGVDVPHHQAAGAVVGQFVPRVELARAAALHHIAFLQQARLELRAHDVGGDAGVVERRGQVDVAAARGLPVLHHEERRVRPALHELPVHQVVLDDEVLPAQRQRAVGAGTQVQPVVGLLARAGQARIDADVHVGLGHLVHEVAAAVIVVRVFGRGPPLHVHARPVAQRHPRRAVDRADPPHQTARPLADFRRHVRVRRVEQPLVERVGPVHPLARRARHVEDALSAVAVHQLVELGADDLHRLVPRDALPAGILALGIRALHGMVDAVGVVRRLDGRLRLRAAVAHGLERSLVALDAYGPPVLDDDLDAALHLAAAAAARFHGHGVVAGHAAVRLFGQRGVRRSAERRGCRTGDGGGLDERAS